MILNKKITEGKLQSLALGYSYTWENNLSGTLFATYKLSNQEGF